MNNKILKTIRLPVSALAGFTMVAGVPRGRVALAPVVPTQNTVVVERSLPMNVVLTSDPQAAGSFSYQPVASWYKNKHWWKRNAPIIGGAGGGTLVGGLVGGGAGALVGGAVGGGGGYLYKRHNEHHQHHYHGYE